MEQTIPRKNWTEDEITLALALYLRTPRSKINQHHPDVIELASLLNRTPSAVSMKMHNLGRCDIRLLARDQKSLSNGSHLDQIVWDKYMGADRSKPLEPLLEAVDAILAEFATPMAAFSFPEVDPTRVTETWAEVKVRRYQRYFRDTVMTMYGGRCLVSGLHSDPLIEVAHIVPWRDNQALRLVPANALTLNVLAHRAYDANLLGIDPDMVIHVSPELLEALNGADEHLRTHFLEANGQKLYIEQEESRPAAEYLDYHYQAYLKHDIQAVTWERVAVSDV